MQILKKLQANLLNSSSAAFGLAIKDNRYTDFAVNLISVKNEQAYHALSRARSEADERKMFLAESKIFRCELLLAALAEIQPQANPSPALPDILEQARPFSAPYS